MTTGTPNRHSRYTIGTAASCSGRLQRMRALGGTAWVSHHLFLELALALILELALALVSQPNLSHPTYAGPIPVLAPRGPHITV